MRAGATARTVVLVHAHPDDETLTTGATMAALRAAGHRVHVITATLGEEGEVIPPELAHLEGSPGLGPWRREELRRALSVLDVDHEVLGEPDGPAPGPTHRDSGMVGSPAASHPQAFAARDPEVVGAQLRDRLLDLGADLVLTYDEHGGYEHPDHVQTHRVTCRAVAGLPAGTRPELYAVLTPIGWAVEDRAWLGAHPEALDPAWTVPSDEPWVPSVVPEEVVTHRVDRPDLVALKSRALVEHATQVLVRPGTHALSNLVAARTTGREGFALLDPATGRPAVRRAPDGRPGGDLLAEVLA